MQSSQNFSSTHYRTGPNATHEGSADLPDWLPVAGGAGLVVLGLAQRSRFGLAAALGGAYLLYRGLRGRPLADLMDPAVLADLRQGRLPRGFASDEARRHSFARPAQTGIDRVDEASMESFPSSDPPATY